MGKCACRLRSVSEWLSILDDQDSAMAGKLEALYGGDTVRARRAGGICRKTLEEFGKSFGGDKEVIIARATGRINLLGMHVDHRGGSVNPIAIREVFFIAEPRDDDLVVLKNVESREFPDEHFRISECLPGRKIADWDAWCHDEFEARKGDHSVTWSNYVRSAVLYIQHLNTKEDGAFDPALLGMNVMVYGNIPRSAGLSSSSSIVVGSAEAFMYLNGLTVSPSEFIDICGYGEWYVGTRGGAGDHSAIKFGRPHSLLHLTSFPLTVNTVPFPADYEIVVANSLVEVKKRVGARDAFNSRVASYDFGLMLARRNFPQYASRLEHLRDINPRNLAVGEAEIYRILKTMPEHCTRAGILRLLPACEADLENIFRSHAEPPEGYMIRQVCVYGIAECIRSDMAPERLNNGDVAGFGELMTLSHDGDRVTKIVDGVRTPIENRYPDEKIDALIEDMESGEPERVGNARLWRQPGGYNVSIPEIDVLVDIARASPGVVGAALVGAGLGGSIAAVVEKQHTGQLIENLSQYYYTPKGLPTRAEAVIPVGGSGVLEV